MIATTTSFAIAAAWSSSSNATIFIIATMLSIFWYVWMFMSNNTHPPLPPDPPSLPLVGNLMSLDMDPLARQVFKVNDTTFSNRDVPVAGVSLSYGESDIVWSPYGDQWRMLRKISVLVECLATKLWIPLALSGGKRSRAP